MTSYLLLTAVVVLFTIGAWRFARRRFQAKWRRPFQDKFKIPVFTSEPIWIECATDMSELRTMGIDMNSSKTKIELDLSIPEHRLAWSVYIER